jgi:hypothetical protein
MAIITSDDDIGTLLRSARTIAVVGLSANPSRDSHRVARYLREQGYVIIPVNPSIPSVLGERSFPSLESIGAPVDIVDVFRRSECMPGIVAAAIRIGARAVWMQFETGHAEAASAAERAGLQVVVERCIMVDHRRLIG